MHKSQRALFPFDLCWIEDGITHTFPYTNWKGAKRALDAVKANGFTAWIEEV